MKGQNEKGTFGKKMLHLDKNKEVVDSIKINKNEPAFP